MKLPQKIYHYTSADALHGILSSGTLHFTDSLFLNDRSERKNFYTTLKRELTCWKPGRQASQPGADLRELLQARYFKGPETIFRKLTATDPAQEEAARYFVLSCSEESDSLPMWNYYTHSIHAAGYNIHFDTNQLLSQLKQHPAFLRFSSSTPLLCKRVIYDEKQKACDIQRLLEMICARWQVCSKSDNREQEHLLKMLDKAFERLSLFYKDRAFSHEKEVRIVIASDNRTIHQPSVKRTAGGSYQFHKVQGAQVPCLALNVLEKGKAITGVTAGPALDKELAVNGVEYMLYYYGFPQTCKVSSVPLRY